MSGHSKWSSIKHKKGAADKKRGQLFSKLSRAIIVAAREGEDELTRGPAEGGAEAVTLDGETYQIVAAPEDLTAVREAVEAAGFGTESSELTMIPKNTVAVEDESTAEKILRLMDALEENDDVQEVYSNFDIPERVLETVAG